MNSALQLDLAETLVEAGRCEEALVEAADAAERIERDEELTLSPEAWRIRGLALAARSDEARAEAAFRAALDLAGAQRALSYRLRAATALADLLARQDRRDEAFELLSAVYSSFTEGSDTRDVRLARAALDKLASRSAL